jgi:xanthine dehydrogenase accessory factor
VGTRSDNIKSIAVELQRLVDEEKPGALALVIRTAGSSPGTVGGKMLVLPDGSIRGTVGGGVLEAKVISDALDILDEGKGPQTNHYKLNELGMSCGGEMTIYIEPIIPPKRVIIYGGGHVGAAISKVMALLGSRITVVDEREEWGNRERFPDAEKIINRPFSEQVAENPPDERDHVVIVTRGHEQDQVVLEGVVDKNPAYIGMIGSKKKAAAAREQLKAKGVPDDLIRKIRSPVGLEIGAVTPEEIAISIAAELVALWRMRETGDSESEPGRES